MAKMEEHDFTRKFCDAIRQTSGWDYHTIRPNIGRLFKNSTRRSDALVLLEKYPPIVVECKFSSSSGTPVEDCRKYMGLECSPATGVHTGQKITLGIAVVYPDGADEWHNNPAYHSDYIKDWFTGGGTFQYKTFRQESSGNEIIWPSGTKEGWLQGDIYDFISCLEKLTATQDLIASVSDRVSDAIKSASSIVIAKLLKHPGEIERISKLVGETQDYTAGINTAALIWFDSTLVLNELCASGITTHNSTNCRNGNSKAVPKKILSAWKDVLNTNYTSVFQPACDTFPDALPESHFVDAFTIILDAVDDIEREHLGRTPSIAGEIYASVLEKTTRENTAAYYTRLEAADYLARLTMPDGNFLPEDFREWKLADFACGTGTLLRSGYRRIKDFARNKSVDEVSLHAHLMSDNGLCGYDISAIAAHLTATNLVCMKPDTPYTTTNIGVIRIGRIATPNKAQNGKPLKERDKVRAGSLELLDKDARLAQLPLQTTDFSGTLKQQKGSKETSVSSLYPKAEDNSFNVILMNPPYSGVHGKKPMFDFPWITETERKAVQQRAGWLAKKTCSDFKAGLVSTFSAIANKKLKEGGKLGLVSPITIAGTSSYLKTREMFEQNFSDIIISFFAEGAGGKASAVSADTGMGECMITATKGLEGRDGIAFVCIDEYFKSQVEATEIAKTVAKTISNTSPGDSGVLYMGSDIIGRYLIDTKGGRVWGAAGINSLLELAGVVQNMIHGKIRHDELSKPIKFDIAKISDIFATGPTHHYIGHLKNDKPSPTSAFELHKYNPNNISTRTSDLSIWSPKHVQDKITIMLEPTHYGTPTNTSTAEQLQNRRAEKTNLFYSRTVRWTFQKALAPRTDQNAMGGRGYLSLQYEGKDADIVKFAFTVWANSIFGFTSHWYQTGKQSEGRSPSGVEDIQNLLIPNFSSPDLIERTKKIISKQSDTKSLFSENLEQCNKAATDEARKKLGCIAAEILGIPETHRDTIVSYISDLWTREESVKS